MPPAKSVLYRNRVRTLVGYLLYLVLVLVQKIPLGMMSIGDVSFDTMNQGYLRTTLNKKFFNDIKS